MSALSLSKSRWESVKRIDSSLQKSSRLGSIGNDLSGSNRLVYFTVLMECVISIMFYSGASSAISVVLPVNNNPSLDASMFNLGHTSTLWGIMKSKKSLPIRSSMVASSFSVVNGSAIFFSLTNVLCSVWICTDQTSKYGACYAWHDTGILTFCSHLHQNHFTWRMKRIFVYTAISFRRFIWVPKTYVLIEK